MAVPPPPIVKTPWNEGCANRREPLAVWQEKKKENLTKAARTRIRKRVSTSAIGFDLPPNSLHSVEQAGAIHGDRRGFMTAGGSAVEVLHGNHTLSILP
jgi:hypothetical protein